MIELVKLFLGEDQAVANLPVLDVALVNMILEGREAQVEVFSGLCGTVEADGVGFGHLGLAPFK